MPVAAEVASCRRRCRSGSSAVVPCGAPPPDAFDRDRKTDLLRPSRAGRAAASARRLPRRRHLRKALPLAAEADPRLRAAAVDFHCRLDPARIVERSSHHYREIGHDLDIGGDRRAAFRAETPLKRLAAIATAVECLEWALHRQRRLWHREDDPECGAGRLLAILAVAHADKSRFGIGRIAHLAAQTTTLDLHSLLLCSPGQNTRDEPAAQRRPFRL